MATPSASGISAPTSPTRHLQARLRLVTDLEPVALLPSNPMIVVSKNAVPAKSLGELLEWLKAKPAPATAGYRRRRVGSHIAGLYFENVTGIKLQYVPYRGTAPA